MFFYCLQYIYTETLLTVDRVIGVDLQVLDVRQTSLVHSAIGVLFGIDGLVESRIDGQLGKFIFHLVGAHAPPQIGQRFFRLVRSISRQQPHWRFRGLYYY